jgi:aspartate/methionine/tyrosine aminotransferase
LAAAHGATILWDQGLSGWTADAAALATLAEHAAQVTLLGEMFPGVGLEGLALGFIATNADNVGALTSMKQIISICTATASQYAGLKAAEGYAGRRDEIRRGLEARRAELVARLQALGAEVLPGQAASHVAVRATAELGAALHAGAVVAADGAGFGAPGVLRLAVPADDTVLAALEGGRA